MAPVRELIGVYHANGGPIGEAKYVIGKFLGTAHCALCDITHSPVRRKPAWNQMVSRLGVRFRLLHLNEMPADVSAVIAECGSPAVLTRGSDGSLVVLLGRDDLETLHGSVASFETAVTRALDSQTGRANSA